jgi:hypothetical protein
MVVVNKMAAGFHGIVASAMWISATAASKKPETAGRVKGANH